MTPAWSLAVLMFAAALPAAAPPIKVIAHSSVTVSHLSSEELKEVFLETRTSLADGSAVEPVLLKDGEVHAAFVRQYIGKTTTGLANYYRSLVFAGKGSMPKMLKTEAEVVVYVRNTRGAIGYVSAATNTDGVAVLELK
jgi:ABC-type phosphate transport system substrate-binding protein